MVWNDERVEQLKKLWADGLSASQIAAQLGEVTRNAVIGKVHRLGLATRASSNRTNSSRLRLRQAQPRRAAQQQQRQRTTSVGNTAFRQMIESDLSHGALPTVEEIEIPLAERKTLQDLSEGMCRWPIGDPQLADFHFCGRNKVTGLPYCEHHARRAYQPPQPRRRDREVGIPALPAAISTKEPAGT